MTAACGGGTSAPTLGASAVTLLASGFIAVALDKYGAGWLKWSIPFLSFPELTLSTFCATDPPAIPTFSAAESKALLQLQFGADFTSALSKLSDLVQHLAWYELCHCTSGALVALPAAPAPPAGTPIYTPPAPQLATPCLSRRLVFSQDQTGINISEDLNTGVWPANPTSLRLRFATGGATGNVIFRAHVQSVNPSVGDFSFPSFEVPTAAMDSTFYYNLALGATNVTINQLFYSGAGLQSFDIHADIFCNGDQPQGTLQPCCPPDPTTALQIDAILRMVTLLQRQAVPFAYLTGTVHSGLTGSGNLEVAGLLGAKVELTTVPGALGIAGALPVEVFDAGFLTWGTDDGYPQSERIRHTPYLSMPSRASAFTDLSYDLHPGVVATITELVREP